MADDLFKIKKGLKLKQSTDTLTEEGGVKYNGSGNLVLRDGSGEKTILDQDNSVTVTNKTIDADNNTISNLAHGAEVDDPSSGVHGVAGSIVGTSDTQTLTNKTIDADSNTITNIENADIKAAAAIDATKIADGSVSSTEFQYLNGVTSAIQTQIDGKISASSTDTLTNKTIDADNNTISNLAHGAEVDNPSSGVHGVTGSVVGTTDTQTLTNKTLTAPVIDVASLTEQGSTPATPSAGTKKFYAKNDGKLYTLDSGGNEIEVGSGSGGGGILYINEDFETGVTNLVAYADAAGTSPVDGTGGSPTLAVAAETGSPLIGTTSAKITKDAANRQGEGAAIVSDTVDSAYSDKVHTVEFLWKTDANYADGDMSLWVVHPTTGTVEALYFRDSLGTYTNELPASSSSVLRVVSAFTPIDSTYRIVLHVASTSATGYVVYVDNIQCGPQKLIPGTIVTEWESFTPTGSWSTNTTYTGKWRRVGDSMDIQYSIALAGTPTAASLYFNLPSGYTIDTAKLSSGESEVYPTLGKVRMLDSGSAIVDGTLAIDATNSRIYAWYDVAGGNYANVNASAPFTWASGDRIVGTITVPISGWDAGAVLSTTQVDVQTAKVEANTNAGTALTANVTNIDFATEREDSHNAWNGSQFTAPATADYIIRGTVRFNAAFSGNLVNYVDGTGGLVVANGQGHQTVSFDTIIRLQKGEQWSLRSDSAATLANSSVHIISIKGLPDFSTFGVFNTFELKTNTSTEKTPSATSQYQNHTNNELVLTPGTWELFGTAHFNETSSAGYSFVQVLWTGADGTDSATTPADLSTVVNIVSAQSAFPRQQLYQSGPALINAPTVIVNVTSTSTIYLTTYAEMSTAANARITVYVNAKRLK